MSNIIVGLHIETEELDAAIEKAKVLELTLVSCKELIQSLSSKDDNTTTDIVVNFHIAADPGFDKKQFSEQLLQILKAPQTNT